MTAYAAFLRVYEPLAAFEPLERRHWEGYLEAGPLPAPALGVEVERLSSLRAMVGSPPPVLPVISEHAHVAELDGVTLVCPWRTRLRSLEALDEFTAQLPEEVVQAFVPGPLVASLEEQLDRWRAAHPRARVHQLSSTWQVPMRWFVLVDGEERQVQLADAMDPATGPAGPGPGGPGPARSPRPPGRSLVYRTAMSRARRRTARALAVLRRTVEDGAVSGGVEDLGRWLEEFHPRSLVELDYGGLALLLDDEALRTDRSAADVSAALAALSAGEPEQAAAAYSRVTARMKGLQAVESSN